jgi:hypothetical protein
MQADRDSQSAQSITRRQFLNQLSIALGEYWRNASGIPIVGLCSRPFFRSRFRLWRVVGAVISERRDRWKKTCPLCGKSRRMNWMLS